MFVIRLLVGFVGRYKALIDEIHQGAIHGFHANTAATLNCCFKLVEFALPNQVRDGRRIDHDLEGSGPTRSITGRQQLLRYNAT